MVYIINSNPGAESIQITSYINGIPRNASLLQKLEIEEQNDRIILTDLPTGQSNTYGVEYINGLPKKDAILLFFLNYWYIPALIILAIIAVSAI